MADKRKTTQIKSVQETWRKPLLVPPRKDAMRAFYQSPEVEPATLIEKNDSPETITHQAEAEIFKAELQEEPPKTVEKSIKEVVAEMPPKVEAESAQDAAENQIFSKENKLSEEKLVNLIGIEIEDLFDIHEILRGKSFDIYLTLLKKSDGKSRYKITQPDLMKLTGIKNRRTFYKHEGWLINLNLLEKRHLPGDHQGIVYRVFQLSEVLPVPGEIIDQLEENLQVFNNQAKIKN